MQDISDTKVIKNLGKVIYLSVFIDRIKEKKEKGPTMTPMNLGSIILREKKKSWKVLVLSYNPPSLKTSKILKVLYLNIHICLIKLHFFLKKENGTHDIHSYSEVVGSRDRKGGEHRKLFIICNVGWCSVGVQFLRNKQNYVNKKYSRAPYEPMMMMFQEVSWVLL